MHFTLRPALRTLVLFLFVQASVGLAQQPESPIGISRQSFPHVLSLVEKGKYLELPPDVFNAFTEATVEAWVKWNGFGNRFQRIFNCGRPSGFWNEWRMMTRARCNLDPGESGRYG